MKSLLGIIFFILLLPASVALGQKTVLEIEMKGGKAQNVFSTTDTYGNLAYIFQESKSIQISILDPAYKITNEFLISREEAEKKNVIIGATLTPQNVVVYLYDDKERNFASLVVDRVTGAYKFNPSIGTLAKTEFLLKSFEMDGQFYSLVIPQYKNTVLLFSSNEGTDFVIKTYDVNFPTLYAKLSSKNDELNQKTQTPVGIEKISYTIENNIKSAYPSKKMYTYGNKIYMTFEEAANTHLVIIDPMNSLAIYRKLNFSLDNNGKESSPKQGNSFLYKGDLFRVTMSNDQMNLIVINLDSMEMLKSYNVFPDQPISFINGTIKEDGSDIQERILRNTQQYFRKLNKGKLAIAVNDLNDGRYETEVGGYEEVTVYRNSGMGGYPISPGLSIGFGMGMGGMGMGMGGMGMGYGGYPGYYDPFYSGYPGYYPYGNNASSTSIHVTYFQSLLKIEDLSHLEGNVPKTMRERINDYEQDVLKKSSPELLNIMHGYTGLVLGYYAKGRSRYNLVEFKR